MNVASINRTPNVILITTHGRMTISPLNANETLFELITRVGIPPERYLRLFIATRR